MWLYAAVDMCACVSERKRERVRECMPATRIEASEGEGEGEGL